MLEAMSGGLLNRRFGRNFLPLPATNDLRIGECAPDFELYCVQQARPVRLSDYRGKQPVVLAFTRIFTDKLFCPICYPHIQDLKQHYSRLREHGAELLVITSTDQAQSARIVRELELESPLLVDTTCTAFRAYKLGQALGAPLPGQFVIDVRGQLRFKHLFSFADANAYSDELCAVLTHISDAASSPSVLVD